MSGEAEDLRVESPCIRNCCLDDADICVGCYRSLSEICAWSESTTPQRLEILARCDARRQERTNRF